MTRALPGGRLVGGTTKRDQEGILASLRQDWTRHYARTLFLAVCAIPTLLAALYFSLIASDRYISETRFVVRSLDKPASQGASAYLQDFGILRANDETFAVQDFVRSRDMMQAVMRQIDLRKVWAPPGSDYFSRYGSVLFDDSDEALFDYFKNQVRVEKNQETGITSVRVSAFDAQQAQAIARIILKQSEAKINEMNTRARADRLSVAQHTSEVAERQLVAANIALTRLRQSSNEIDPAREAGAAVQRNSLLEREIAQLEVTLETILARAPANPAIPAMRQRLTALKTEAGARRAALTDGSTDSRPTLASKIDEMSRLETEAEVATKTYEAAQSQLATAQEANDRQQVFVVQITAPNLPDAPLEPRRWRYFFTVALLSFWSFLIFYLLVSGSREHLNLN